MLDKYEQLDEIKDKLGIGQEPPEPPDEEEDDGYDGNVAFDSGLLEFSSDETVPVEVHHNLGQAPRMMKFFGDENGVLGFPTLFDADDQEIECPYLQGTQDPNTIKVFKPEAYNFSGKFRIICYN